MLCRRLSTECLPGRYSYVQHDRNETEVLFTLLAERYERKSVVSTTNLVFSEWDCIFNNPMTTLAAIDRTRPLRGRARPDDPEELSRRRPTGTTLKTPAP